MSMVSRRPSILVGEQNRLWHTILRDDHLGVLLFDAAENIEEM